MSDEIFTRIQSIYPKRDGAQRWADARKAYNARLREKHTPEEILAGVERYALYVRAKGQERTCYVQQAATFLGANKGFLEEWIQVKPVDPKSVVLTHSQRHSIEMAALLTRRDKIGIGSFRDPKAGETVSQYRQAQEDEWHRVRDRNTANIAKLDRLLGSALPLKP